MPTESFQSPERSDERIRKIRPPITNSDPPLSADYVELQDKARALGLSPDYLDKKDREATKYLSEHFSIIANIIPPGIILKYIQLSMEDPEDIDSAQCYLNAQMIRNDFLLDDGIRRCLGRLGVAESIKDDEYTAIADNIRKQIEENIAGSIRVMDCLHMNSVVGDYSSSFEIDTGIIEQNRNEAIAYNKKHYGEILERWNENEFCMEDKEMAKYFDCENLDCRYLTTYFGTARFGLTNRKLVEEAVHFDRRHATEEHAEFVKMCKRIILERFESNKSGNPSRSFLPENCAFTRNGTSAFELFYDRYLKDGDTVLATADEYCEIIDVLNSKQDKPNGERKRINIVRLSEYKDEKSYLEEVRTKLEGVDYMLVSSTSRKGPRFPLEGIREVLNGHERNGGRHVDLIVDSCQAVGREKIDFHKFRPDVFIGSCQKGSDFGGPVGLLALSKEFVADSRHGGITHIDDRYLTFSHKYLEKNKSLCKHKKIEDSEKGTLSRTDMARFTLAVAPESIGTLSDERMTISVPKREQAIKSLSLKFIELVKAINGNVNKDHGVGSNKIEIQSPIEKDRLSGIFECKVQGLNRCRVSEIARKYGVTIHKDHEDGTDPDSSFRISMHPFMGNDAISILGYALEVCAREANDQSADNTQIEERRKNLRRAVRRD